MTALKAKLNTCDDKNSLKKMMKQWLLIGKTSCRSSSHGAMRK
jgi:hypothetical protein